MDCWTEKADWHRLLRRAAGEWRDDSASANRSTLLATLDNTASTGLSEYLFRT